MAESKSGGGSSATQERETKTDAALKSERTGGRSSKDEKRHGIERDREGNVQTLEYPEHEPLDEITYRDPRPLDWPQKADRSVFVGVVHQADPDGDPKGDYVDNAGLADQDELKLKGTKVEDAQVIAGGGRLVLIVNGDAFDVGSLGGGIQADLAKGLELNANS